MSSARIVMLSCALSLAAAGMAAAQASGNASPSLDVSMLASSAEGAEANVRLAAAGAELRLWAGDTSAELSAGLALPGVRLGATKLSGLAAFLYRPAAADPLLLGADGAPLRLDNPESASWLGASLGEDFGLFAIAPRADAGRTAYGAWLSPRGGKGQAMLVATREPAQEGGPSWYDPPVPAATRFWSAFAVGAGGKAWAIAGAGAAGTGFPGPDVGACRLEARASAGSFRGEFEASAASASWRAPDGKDAPALRLDAELRWSRRGVTATGGYRLVVDDLAEQEAAKSTARASFAAAGRLGQAKSSASVLTGPDGGLPSVELNTGLRPGLLPWLTLSSSWRAAGGEAQRLDLFASIDAGGAVRFCFDAGLRLVPEGRRFKGSFITAMMLGRVGVEAGVRTGGWVEPVAISPGGLDCFLGLRARLR
ncbi:MAG: hypothetical protein CVV51_14180 [Spirochaetae bacterium HGW-Spirochaetae-7]|nr:MAG: hypothetical protein CVV51_14180 [Spirochaetae bacterium HGW-Spirochaetae-7]